MNQVYGAEYMPRHFIPDVVDDEIKKLNSKIKKMESEERLIETPYKKDDAMKKRKEICAFRDYLRDNRENIESGINQRMNDCSNELFEITGKLK